MTDAGPIKPAPRKRRLVARANIRLTANELAELSEAAAIAKVSLSEYVRRRSLGRPVIASADLATVSELRRLGGLLKHVHTESGGAYSEATAAAITAIRRHIEGMNSP